MKRTVLIILSLVFASSMSAQNMRKSAQTSLFSDNKALLPGDVVTILVVESISASNNAETSAGRKSDIGLSASGNVGNTTAINNQLALGTNNNFQGSGSTKTTGNISTRISAIVDTVFADGNMVISGSKKISINGEDQIIRIKGIVRPSDISTSNSVYSYNISQAEITFEGNGIIDNVQKPGWITKFLHWLF